MIPVEVTDHAMIKEAITQRACVVSNPTCIRDSLSAEPHVFPLGWEKPIQWVAGDVEWRSAYFFAMAWHTSSVFSI